MYYNPELLEDLFNAKDVLIRQDLRRYRQWLINFLSVQQRGDIKERGYYYYEEKIAGVLTTVLAASLFVGGNVPVTTQVGSMAAESQEDEDTQADEAEAESGEDTQSEVDEEEAK